MTTLTFMTLPVYRLTSEKYYEQQNDRVKNHILESPYGQGIEIQPQQSMYEDHLRKSFGGEWKYNEIIGFIELHFCGAQIRGEYWQNDKKKHTKTRKKQFVYITHKLADETNIHRDATNKDIESLIEKYIKKCRKELKNKYIDDSNFTNLRGFVNWVSLLHSACS